MYPGVAQLVARLLWECVDPIHELLDKSPECLAARAIAGFPPVAENGTKAALTT